MFDYSSLRGRIFAKCKTQEIFAERLGITGHTLSHKLHNKAEWKQREIQKACEILDIRREQIGEYFFSHGD
ncbi:MAG: DUF739 family protein [Oscillospiraceae bacterium]|nr:DUF739 family protein [Oscillospiraceae bacterium]